MRDVGINGKKSSLHFGNSGCRLLFGDVGWAFMPTRFQAALGHRTRGQQVPSLRLLRACIPHTPYTSVLKFVPPAGRVCGAATHAVGGDAGYGLLFRTSLLLSQTRQRIRLAVYRNRVFFQAALGSGFQLPFCPIGKVIPFEVFQPKFVA